MPGPASQAASFARQIDREGETWDKVIEWVVPIVGATFGSLLSPELANAGSWFAIFIATLTWSGGCAAATYLIMSHKMNGAQMVGTVATSLLGALAVACILGYGVLDVSDTLTQVNGHVPPIFTIPVAFLGAAVLTYGPVGALLSAGIGIWLGHRFLQHFPPQ
ncbi:hypothetical protein Acsp06_19660 [Actinomycetospora sp. NBRC 106375]|uniref:hypothetical protein n=1 Tax=Actinomycetospora sp. NBRC 106375 TaxID=3032207 RepID=UPI0024A38299|nr:hypothetical protein [Actinomycetospora sp. NBRC 106375]GLZ45781.1 hypothetical protein Acsp06_19660 [Actinomycetospora sp. NBRC 106375]